MPPKKNVKMDLSSFLADDTFGSATDSWADEFDPSMIQNPSSTIDIGFELPSSEPVIPEQPPYTARIASFPDGTTEDDLRNFFVEGLKLAEPEKAIEDFYCPKDLDGSLKPFAFITFVTRELLVAALALNDQPIHNRAVYVSVAKPSKRERRSNQEWGSARGSRPGHFEDEADIDWSGARGGRSQREPYQRDSFQREPRREEVEINWDGARGGREPPVRDDDRSFRGPSRERRPLPRDEDFNWGSARGSQTQPEVQERSFRGPPRERTGPPREDNFNWGAARGSQTQPEVQERHFRSAPRERHAEPKDDSFNWGAARGSLLNTEPRRTYQKPKPDNLDWEAKGSMLNKEKAQAKPQPKTEKKESTIDGPKKSMFSVLQDEDEDNVDENEDKEEKEKDTNSDSKDQTDEIAKSTAELSLNDESGWTVPKK